MDPSVTTCINLDANRTHLHRKPIRVYNKFVPSCARGRKTVIPAERPFPFRPDRAPTQRHPPIQIHYTFFPTRLVVMPSFRPERPFSRLLYFFSQWQRHIHTARDVQRRKDASGGGR